MLPEERRERRALVAQRVFVAHSRIYVIVNAFLIAVWAMTGAGYFWPAWVLLGWGLSIVIHGMATFARPHRY